VPDVPSVREKVAGASIIIVDDVITTGATISDAKRALIEAGAADTIFCLAIAH
jgi:predicted amidophosphoribosyltransferase